MTTFRLYLELGIHHIANLAGYDHILFIAALCAVYAHTEWRRVLVLVTAFTIGHSITLALASTRLIHYSTALIELLIPVTIFLTGLFNVLQKKEDVASGFHRLKYATALFFGLIHGLGFSNYLRGLLGDEEHILLPLFSFNLGLEIGQILIVIAAMIVSALLVNLAGVRRRDWNLVLSGAAMGVSLILIIDRLPQL